MKAHSSYASASSMAALVETRSVGKHPVNSSICVSQLMCDTTSVFAGRTAGGARIHSPGSSLATPQ